MWQRFTERARRVILLGQDEAGKLNSGYVGTEHLLIGLVRENEGVGARVLLEMGVTRDQVREEVKRELTAQIESERIGGEPKLTPKAKRVLELAADEARRMRHNYIGTEHLLLALLREKEGQAATVLRRLGVKLEATRTSVFGYLEAQPEAGRSRNSDGTSEDFAPEILELLAAARRHARNDSRDSTEVKDVLRALCQSESEGAQILREAGVDIEALLAHLEATKEMD